MPRILSHAFLIVAVLAATGSHWILLQSMAWTGMIAGNLRTASLTQAVERAFSGDYPCALCKQISKGKEAEKQAEFKVEVKKLECVLSRPVILPHQPLTFAFNSSFDPPLASLSHPPAVPPPRSLLS